jgi:hypothetical protein
MSNAESDHRRDPAFLDARSIRSSRRALFSVSYYARQFDPKLRQAGSETWHPNRRVEAYSSAKFPDEWSLRLLILSAPENDARETTWDDRPQRRHKGSVLVGRVVEQFPGVPRR